MNGFILTEVFYQRGRSGRLLNCFRFVGHGREVEVVLADDSLPLTEEKFAQYLGDYFGSGSAERLPFVSCVVS
jgi:hypothetical protein